MKGFVFYSAAIAIMVFLVSACWIVNNNIAKEDGYTSVPKTQNGFAIGGNTSHREEEQTSITVAETTSTVIDVDKETEQRTTTLKADPGSLLSQQAILVRLYREARPGVVSIRAPTFEGYSLGSGFVLDKQGHILTNYHVVKSQADVEVVFSSGYSTYGKIDAFDPDSDLAIIKVEVPEGELKPLPLGDSDQVEVGQFVVAIGNPFGLEGTMTSGIVAGLGNLPRSFRNVLGDSSLKIAEIILTDAAINPGSSGGPLLNLNGEVIGVNETIVTDKSSSENSGIGFALAINMAKRIAGALIQEGTFVYPYIGISSLDEITLWEQKILDLPGTKGVYVISVVADSPAAKAGIQGGSEESGLPGVPSGGDLITVVDGISVSNFNEMMVYFIKYKNPGDTVVLKILRDNSEIEVELTLGERPVINIEDR